MIIAADNLKEPVEKPGLLVSEYTGLALVDHSVINATSKPGSTSPDFSSVQAVSAWKYFAKILKKVAPDGLTLG